MHCIDDQQTYRFAVFILSRGLSLPYDAPAAHCMGMHVNSAYATCSGGTRTLQLHKVTVFKSAYAKLLRVYVV